MQYRESLREVFLNPPHTGEAAEPNFVGRAASFECGALIDISLHIDESQHIADARFKSAGCSALVASASRLIDQVLGKSTADAAALCQGGDEFAKLGEGLPAERNECALLAVEAMLGAIQTYSGSARDVWEGDDALICTCFCVSERTIEREIQTKNLATIAEVTAACNAGGGCRSCYSLIEYLLEEVNRK